MKQTILMTGATSYIAVNLIHKFLQDNCNIFCVVRPNSPNLAKVPKNPNVHLLELDMNHIEQLEHMSLPKIDCLYHFAWEGVRGSDRNNIELQHKNLEQTKKLIDAAVSMDISYIIGIGSQAEYGDQAGKLTEETEPFPTMEYGKIKLEACSYGLDKCKNTNSRFLWGRIFSTYGPGEVAGTLIMTCMDKMLKDEPIDLSPCEHMWNYLYITEVADILHLMFRKKANSGIYNIASEDTRYLKDFVDQMKVVLNSKSQLNYGSIPYGNTIPNGIMPCVKKLNSELDWTQKIRFEEGISNLMKFKLAEKEK